ncbi:hypothetical protein KK137_15825 [Croceibacterium sp. LX-88]|jgi:hypothetical protein|uniref:Ferrochelatase n=1 Tax=Croceibacterium selenioxidans TaxID=2838833 RepID=A0ABS5W9K5_9SPHN|nr:hypothetical protein [Croceibacterium selenioxidans]MBT2135807.1 hypothetical protein [Croceibacterium selenioxidans]
MIRQAIISSALALSLVAGTTAQAAVPARAPAPVSTQSEEVAGVSTIWIVGGALVAIVLLILILDDDDNPTSP